MINEEENLAAKQAIALYEKLYRSVPDIGFLSRKKRVLAYLSVTDRVQAYIDKGELDEDNAQFLLSLLVRKHAAFQKAAMMAALNLATIDKLAISAIGFIYANAVRCNMKMQPVH